MRTLCSLALCSLLGGCSGPGAEHPPLAAAELPPLPEVPLTSSMTLRPRHPVLPTPDRRQASVPANLQAMLAEGFGEVLSGPGEGHLVRTPPAMTPPAVGKAPRLLVRFAHLADAQLADDESPTRLASFDRPTVTDAAFRPQESYQCRVLNAAVRTLNRVHQESPLSFVVLGGDNADSAQQNEVSWFTSILSGAPQVRCDSGDENDPEPGPNNDGKDAFLAEGLKVPWYWVTGNHDILVQGNLPVTAAQVAAAQGDSPNGGTRDWSQPGGPLTSAVVAADPRRRPLRRTELMQQLAADGSGHGIGAAQVNSGKAFYTFDVGGTPLRFLVLDTGSETGGAQGMLRRGDVESVVKPMLEEARRQGKWVVLAAHHAADNLSNGDEFGGTQQADALLEADWMGVLAGYPNVILSLAGHDHQHRVRYLTTPQAGVGHWEVRSAALADYPHQMRLLEIWDQDNGWLMVRTTALDYSTNGDEVAAEGRRRGVLDYVSGWHGNGLGGVEDRNVELWVPRPSN